MQIDSWITIQTEPPDERENTRKAGGALQGQGGQQRMNIELRDLIKKTSEIHEDSEDYTGEDGLLYCGKCHTPKESYFIGGNNLWGRDRHPRECDCQRAAREEQEAAEEVGNRRRRVERLKEDGFTDEAMVEWTFANDSGKCRQMHRARTYVEHWEEMQQENIGLLLWGKVGTGKSFFAGCIANALMEREIPVRMTNFALILNDLSSGTKDRNEYIHRLCSYPLLILDDFGMERGTEYGLEQVYNVIDGRYRSGKPLIATTNLTLEELKHPEDTPHERIYDRLLTMCAPVSFAGENFRKATAQEKMERLRTLLGEEKSS